jgi:DNA polymerase-3 subunit epsilon
MLKNIELDRPICFFDIQTTGLNFKEDRIVEIYIKKISPDKSIEEYHELINPGDVEIAQEAEDLHGLTKEMLKDKPLFKDLAKAINEFIGDSHIGGYFVAKFDLPFLMEELHRSGILFNFKKNNRKIIDAKNIYVKSFNPNSIDFAYKYLTGNTLQNEEKSAKINVDASIEILEESLKTIETNDLEEIQKHSEIGNFFDLTGKIAQEDGEIILNFGRYRGKTVFAMIKEDPSYYRWMMQSDDIGVDTKYILKVLHGYLEKKNAK